MDIFHPSTRAWFASQHGEPTDAQTEAWPLIATGQHVLVSAPTGTGKTLAAFMWPLDQLITGQWPLGVLSVLYISPLKALNNDIQRNLLTPLSELRAQFARDMVPWHEPQVMTRSGDTSPRDRQRMLRRPPEILITTPESLNLMLSSVGGRGMLHGIRMVILDEIHAVLDSKRGTHLATAVERLAHQNGEFQRVALSATVHPIDPVTRFVGGFSSMGSARPVVAVRPPSRKDIELVIERAPLPPSADTTPWQALAPRLLEIIDRNRSIVIFVNSRRLSETVATQINHHADAIGRATPLAYAHHGSLAKDVRLDVEKRLKQGRLKAIVATGTLEMGIDVGSLDEVVLIQAPHSVASATQRIGRAGHSVGQTSRATLIAVHARDLLDIAVLGDAVIQGDLEDVVPLKQPLDVLTQVILSMTVEMEWSIDDVYDIIRMSHPYQALQRDSFDRVIAMLFGRYDNTRIRELRPRLSISEDQNRITARRGVAQSLYANGGTIPNRGLYRMRHTGTHDQIGELDEEFVWENGPGSRFTIGNRQWIVDRVSHSDVFVSPYAGDASTPFWKAEEPQRSFHLSNRINKFLEACEQTLSGGRPLQDLFRDQYSLGPHAASDLEGYLKRQRASTGCLPHSSQIIIEEIAAASHGAGRQLYIHAAWGRQLTRPFALALEAASHREFGFAPEFYAGNDGLGILLPEDHEFHCEPLFDIVRADSLSTLLRETLESSTYYGAQFRESAHCALLITRGAMGKRLPLWLSRVRAQELMEAVAQYADFPISLEAWRSCLQDEFDLPNLGNQLNNLHTGHIEIINAKTPVPSPFAQSEAWRQINSQLYRDEATANRPSSLHHDLIQDIVHSPGQLVRLPSALATDMDAKLQRILPEYAPQTPSEVIDWIDERGLITLEELELLLAPAGIDTTHINHQLALSHSSGAHVQQLVCTIKEYPHLSKVCNIPFSCCDGEPLPPTSPATTPAQASTLSEYVALWLRYRGPVAVQYIHSALAALSHSDLHAALTQLSNQQTIVRGNLIEEDDDEYVCDRRNYEILLRRLRTHRSDTYEPVPLERLALHAAQHQGVMEGLRGYEGLTQLLERISCYPAPAELWETDILPARLNTWDPLWLDRAALNDEVSWIGAPNKQVAILHPGDIDLYQADRPKPSSTVIPDEGGYTYDALQRATGFTTQVLCETLWEEVWAGVARNDTFNALRVGILSGYKPPSTQHTRGRRGHRSNRSAGTLSGRWYSTPNATDPDPIEADELGKERVKLLLGRYPVLFRELLEREAAALQWSRLFRSLRLMELSGEVLSGSFYEGIPGLQFTTRENLSLLENDDQTPFWLNACDPSSMCGLKCSNLNLPARRRTTHLVYIGTQLALVSYRNGRRVDIHISPDDPQMVRCLSLFNHLLKRPLKPLKRVVIEVINNKPATESVYVKAFEATFNAQDEGTEFVLYRR